MSDHIPHDVVLSHSAKDKGVVRSLAERLRQDGMKVPFDFGCRNADVGFAMPGMPANAFGSDWAQLDAGTFRFRDPLNRELRFIPLRLDDAPIKRSMAQFLYINWRQADLGQEYAKLLVNASRVDLLTDSSRKTIDSTTLANINI